MRLHSLGSRIRCIYMKSCVGPRRNRALELTEHELTVKSQSPGAHCGLLVMPNTFGHINEVQIMVNIQRHSCSINAGSHTAKAEYGAALACRHKSRGKSLSLSEIVRKAYQPASSGLEQRCQIERRVRYFPVIYKAWWTQQPRMRSVADISRQLVTFGTIERGSLTSTLVTLRRPAVNVHR